MPLKPGRDYHPSAGMASFAQAGEAQLSGMEAARGPFQVPTRGIYSQADLKAFHQSKTYADFMVFVRLLNERVRGVAVSDAYPVGPVVERLVSMLDALYSWVDEIPPLQQPMRFGNQAFRQWHARLVDRSPAMVKEVLPKELDGAVVELLPYLTSGFGHPSRIDYGTGHESSFVLFLYCLFRLQVLAPGDLVAVGLRVFSAYLRVMRRLQTVYMLEPAGSHGVWGLDDYHCLVFLWGSAQLMGNQQDISPSSIHHDEVLREGGGDWLYLSAIAFIKELKKGVPFAESSPMLNDISGLPTWSKVNTGMLRLYEGEVLGKLPVIQHFLFGSIFPCTWTPSSTPDTTTSAAPAPPVEGGGDAAASHHHMVETAAPWASRPPPPPPASSGRGQQQQQHLPAECCRAPWANVDG